MRTGKREERRQNIITALSIIASIGIVLFALNYTKEAEVADISQNNAEETISVPPVREEGGIQIAHVFARGGYSPRKLVLSADKPAKLEIETRGTYDCSTAFTIPALNFKKQLPPTGTTTIEIPPQKKGTKFTGLCSMGMYAFDIDFQ